jgi:tetratricopeptide (TPR) repeat protein
MIYAAKHDTAGEMRELDAAIDDDPKLIEPRLKLAELQTDRGLWQKAIELYKGAIAQDKTVGAAYIGLARLYEVNRQPHAAQETLEQGAQATPQDGLVLIELADLYNRHGLTRQAEVAYTNAARVGNAKLRADALQKLGDVYAATQRYREAFICYAELARSHDPSASVMADKRYHQVMGVVDKAVGKSLDVAFEMLDKYTQPTPQITRVEAFEVISESVKQLKDMSAFTSDILPPSSLKTENAQRALYYSLAQEAAVGAQAYIDTGDKDVLQAARQRLNDAHDEQTRLAGMAGK